MAALEMVAAMAKKEQEIEDEAFARLNVAPLSHPCEMNDSSGDDAPLSEMLAFGCWNDVSKITQGAQEVISQGLQDGARRAERNKFRKKQPTKDEKEASKKQKDAAKKQKSRKKKIPAAKTKSTVAPAAVATPRNNKKTKKPKLAKDFIAGTEVAVIASTDGHAAGPVVWGTIVERTGYRPTKFMIQFPDGMFDYEFSEIYTCGALALRDAYDLYGLGSPQI